MTKPLFNPLALMVRMSQAHRSKNFFRLSFLCLMNAGAHG